MIDAALLHDFVCGVSRFDFSVDGNISVSYRAVPNVVVAFAATDELATVFGQNDANFLFVFSHYANAALSYLSQLK